MEENITPAQKMIKYQMVLFCAWYFDWISVRFFFYFIDKYVFDRKLSFHQQLRKFTNHYNLKMKMLRL